MPILRPKKSPKNVDTGQRYVVFCRNGLGQERPYGYTDKIEQATLMEKSILSDPEVRVPRIVDRHDRNLCQYQSDEYQCPKGARQKFDPDLEAEIVIPCPVCGATKLFTTQPKLDKKSRIVTI